jgi:hypothetical protein
MTWAYEAIERDIPKDRVVDLTAILGSSPDTKDDFAMIEDLASAVVFSGQELRRRLARRALTGFLQSPTEVYKMSTEDEIFVYLTLNGVEDGFLFVGAYPNQMPGLEPAITAREISALSTYADI